jgi:uncharacterized membrane protein YccC
LGLLRIAEVLLGCAVGIVVTWLLLRLWSLPDSRDTPG